MSESKYEQYITFKCTDTDLNTTEVSRTIEGDGNIYDIVAFFLDFLRGEGYAESCIRECINVDKVEWGD